MGATKDIIVKLAARPQGVTNGEVAEAAGLKSENAGGALSGGINSGWLFKAKRKLEHTRYFGTQQAATDWLCGEHPPGTILDHVTHSVIARAAVKSFRAGDIRSSFELAERCSCTPEILDQAFAPLVDAGKLLRVPTQRSGIDMFTYRFSSCWVPKDEDFNFHAAGATPKAAVSPVAPPKAKALSTAQAPGSKPPAAPAKARAAPATTPTWSPAPSPSNLGFAIASQPLAGTGGASLDAVVECEGNSLIDAGDLAFAINSEGEFVIDLGQGDLVRFSAGRALQLKRFLGNTTILEALAGAA